MPRFTTSLDIYLIDVDGPITVQSDQRDLAKWEVQKFRDETRANLRARFVGWCAARREGAYSASWDDFNERHCISVENTPGTLAGEGDEQGLDPGKTEKTTATN